MKVESQRRLPGITRQNAQNGVVDPHFVEDDVRVAALLSIVVSEVGPFAFRRNVDFHTVDEYEPNMLWRIENDSEIHFKKPRVSLETSVRCRGVLYGEA